MFYEFVSQKRAFVGFPIDVACVDVYVDETPIYAVHEHESNVTCLLLQANISVTFNYTINKTTTNVHSYVPRNASYDGQCGRKTEAIDIEFPCGNLTCSLELHFTNSSTVFNLTAANLTYIGEGFSHAASHAYTSKMYSNLGTYYNCSKGFNLTLEKGVMVKMTDVKVQAFMDDKSGKPSFGSTGMSCDSNGGGDSGTKTDAIVPIAVGQPSLLWLLLCLLATVLAEEGPWLDTKL
ncbi:hypothetical protein EB796_006370 [Bugula neritina]|uniref:Lysosome-associated membrane glycoprotein 5 n=1 Tax=Bugula neritina TaxID=10212 RepID=A0A7J7KBV1_BUGNE|nr:hypothetical protein EB796_006370 [Bugula neritina]